MVPFYENENFRLAFKSYNSDEFATFDQKIRSDITFPVNNLQQKYGCSEKGALKICLYLIDNKKPE
ncbi:MAG: hypothetical protein JXQ65_04125 [Candidatus Marinimicrobia bacterium]|nr:hypothetical protein [Candidatus Neomarinimicrobiota bacterium]